MSDTRTNWVQVGFTGLAIIAAVFITGSSMSTESAVRGEQIRDIQEDARDPESDGKKNAERIRLVEREVDGLGPAVQAVKDIADSNALKLDALLNRGRVSNNGLVSAREEDRERR